MATVETKKPEDCPVVNPNDWVVVMDHEEGHAYCELGAWRVLWSENKPDAKDQGLDMPGFTQVLNVTDGRMWGRTDPHYNGQMLIRVTTLVV